MHERSALNARKDGFIDGFGKFFAAQNQPAARTAQSFMRRRRDEFAMRNGRRMQTGGDQPGDMRDVRHHDRADRFGDLADPCKINRSRIGATRRR